MESFTLYTYIFLWIGGFAAGFIDSIAGGGGIISLPVLLSVGMPAHTALGTNKFQSTFGSLTATIQYSKEGLITKKDIFWAVFFTAIGAVLGTYTIQHIPATFLQKIIPVLLIAIFVYLLFSPQLGINDTQPKMSPILFYALFGISIGFYDGFFGPGTGSFWPLAFIFYLGFNLKKATAHTKLVNFISNIISLAVFMLGNNVLFLAGTVMGTGQITGAWLGSKLVILKGVRFIRIFFLIVIALTIAKLMYSTYF